MYLDNKYTRWYNSIIESRKNNPVEGYKEEHHILPISLGGSNEKTNLVSLSAREHFICHWLLTKMTTGKSRLSMLHALHCMRRTSFNQQRYSSSITARVYKKLKEDRSYHLSMEMSGSGNHMYGRSGSNAPGFGRTGDKHPFFGKKHKESSKEQTRLKLAGVPKSKESNIKRSASLTGLAKPRFTCIHCNKSIGGIMNLRRHENACNKKPA